MQLIMMYSPFLDKEAIVTVKQPEEKVQELAVEFASHSIYFFVELTTDIDTKEYFWVFSNELRNLQPLNPDADEDQVSALAKMFPEVIYFTRPERGDL